MNRKDSKLYKNKYRVKSTRLPDWDYSANGHYFVTICTLDREYYFGEIGNMARHCWLEIPNHFPFVMLDEFIVMPNHIHGILIIEHGDITAGASDTVETQNFASLRQQPTSKPIYMQKNGFKPQSENLSSIVRGFKIGVKKYATMNHIDFAWQPRFYDHVIRNDNDLHRIREYIIHNPDNWETDELCRDAKFCVSTNTNTTKPHANNHGDAKKHYEIQ